MKCDFFVCLLALCLCGRLSAQQTFTSHLQKAQAGKGTVVLHQDATIDRLVNGGTATVPASDASEAQQPGNSVTDVSDQSSGSSRARMKANGYRIQVYSGGNSRMARQEATKVGGQVKALFPELQVYTHFKSPRWICRVGDFKTYEEANEVFRALRETQKFGEAIIVKSVILIPY
ncbi:MAG: SPOR domain-containing protein [Paraprevotella sp.]|nr:SPOR domain-containing protein [Paraprevotella sp.]